MLCAALCILHMQWQCSGCWAYQLPAGPAQVTCRLPCRQKLLPEGAVTQPHACLNYWQGLLLCKLLNRVLCSSYDDDAHVTV
jgi:hypothetical protein